MPAANWRFTFDEIAYAKLVQAGVFLTQRFSPVDYAEHHTASMCRLAASWRECCEKRQSLTKTFKTISRIKTIFAVEFLIFYLYGKVLGSKS